MIRVRFLRSFDDSLQDLPPKERGKVEAALRALLDYFDGAPKPIGLGLRKLQGRFWEVRVGLGRRVLFSLDDDLATFVIVGDHDQVRRRLQRGI